MSPRSAPGRRVSPRGQAPPRSPGRGRRGGAAGAGVLAAGPSARPRRLAGLAGAGRSSGPGAEAPTGKLRSEVRRFGNAKAQLCPLPPSRVSHAARRLGAPPWLLGAAPHEAAGPVREGRCLGSGLGRAPCRERQSRGPRRQLPAAPARTRLPLRPTVHRVVACARCLGAQGSAPSPGSLGGSAAAPPVAPNFLPTLTWKSSLRGLLTCSLKKRRPQVCAEDGAEAPPGGLQVLFLQIRFGVLRSGLEAS